jgi:hypothetical protein
MWKELPGCFELPAWGVVGLLVLESTIRASNVYIHVMSLELARKDRNTRKPRSHRAIDGEMRGSYSSGSRSARMGRWTVQIAIFKLLFIVLDDSRYMISDVCNDRQAEDAGREAGGESACRDYSRLPSVWARIATL